MVVAGALAVLAFAGIDVVWPYFLLAFLGGAAWSSTRRTATRSTFQLVGRDELPNAVALNSSLFNAGRVVGPAVGGVLIAAVGAGWCFAVNAASFLAVLAGLLMMRAVGALLARPHGRRHPHDRRRRSARGSPTSGGRREVLLVLLDHGRGQHDRRSTSAYSLPVLASKTLHAGAAVVRRALRRVRRRARCSARSARPR